MIRASNLRSGRQRRPGISDILIFFKRNTKTTVETRPARAVSQTGANSSGETFLGFRLPDLRKSVTCSLRRSWSSRYGPGSSYPYPCSWPVVPSVTASATVEGSTFGLLSALPPLALDCSIALGESCTFSVSRSVLCERA